MELAVLAWRLLAMDQSQVMTLILNILSVLAIGAGAATFIDKKITSVKDEFHHRLDALDKKVEALRAKWEDLPRHLDKTYRRIDLCDERHANERVLRAGGE